MTNRIKNALILLKEGHSLTVDKLTLSMENEMTIKITGWISSPLLGNITKTIAISELEKIKDSFNSMVTTSIELQEYIRNKSLKYALSWDDYGKVGIEICSETEGEFEFYLSNLKQ